MSTRRSIAADAVVCPCARSHGTRCAGDVAASSDNGVCGVGVAFDARVGGVRLLDGVVTDAMEGRALSLRPEYIDIVSASWGPEDDGEAVTGRQSS